MSQWIYWSIKKGSIKVEILVNHCCCLLCFCFFSAQLLLSNSSCIRRKVNFGKSELGSRNLSITFAVHTIRVHCEAHQFFENWTDIFYKSLKTLSFSNSLSPNDSWIQWNCGPLCKFFNFVQKGMIGQGWRHAICRQDFENFFSSSGHVHKHEFYVMEGCQRKTFLHSSEFSTGSDTLKKRTRVDKYWQLFRRFHQCLSIDMTIKPICDER